MIRTKTTAEIIEEARDRVAAEDELMREIEQERLRQRSLTECYDIIKSWKKKYFKKSSKSRAAIYARINSQLIQGNWISQYHISIFRKGNLVELFNVRHEAFDVLTRGLESQVNPGTKITMETFTLYIKEEVAK